MDVYMNHLLILSLILIIIIMIVVISYYIYMFKREKIMKHLICKNNLDCSSNEVCMMDIDKQKRCYHKNNIIQRICTELII